VVTFYATVPAGDERPYMPEVPYLFPASSFARPQFKMRPPRIPSHVKDVAADCGGYVATVRWGEYRYTPDEYVNWLRSWKTTPTWAATMDFCCERDIATNKSEVMLRQDKTTDMAYLFWEQYRDCPWAWVPTIQGWNVEDYVRHANELKPLVLDMQKHYADGWRIGIGTLCQRADSRMIRDVVMAVTSELPNMPIHLWGVKLGAFKSNDGLPEEVTSMDSAAWNGLFGTNRERWRQSGLPQREWSYKVALPEYLVKIDRLLQQKRQLRLF
jgi:hypothetical protein